MSSSASGTISKSSSSSSSGISSSTSESDSEDEESSGLMYWGGGGGRTAANGWALARIRSRRRASISAAPLNLGWNSGETVFGGSFGNSFCSFCSSATAVNSEPATDAPAPPFAPLPFVGTSIPVSLLVGDASCAPSIALFSPAGTLGPTSVADLIENRYELLLAALARFPFTLNPIAPTLLGPMIVVVYFNPVAPNRRLPGLPESPSSSLGAGLLGMASSGHFSTSERPEA